jgi:beta-lactamase regulating signal transducer with metallopeptidase domain
MSVPWVSIGAWVCHTAAGGGLLLLLAWCLMRGTRQPARQQRLGECGLAAALLLAVLRLGPGWLPVAVPLPEAAAVPAPVAEANPGPSPEAVVAPPLVLVEGAPPPVEVNPAPRPTVAAPRSAARPTALLGVVGLLYALAAGLLAARWLLGHLALWRLLRTAAPAPAPVARLFAEAAAGRRPPRLLVSRRLRVPVSCGLFRPTVVLPARLCDDPGPLRWVFAHELTHLERRDPWTCVLFGLGQVVYFYLPWFWWARRQVGLCQEYIADAAVAAGEAAPEDYAQFLLGLTRTPAVPAGAASVAGRPSDLRRRLVMLLQASRAPERRCPWLWSGATAVGLAALAVPAAGVRLEATSPPSRVAAVTDSSGHVPDAPPRPEPTPVADVVEQPAPPIAAREPAPDRPVVPAPLPEVDPVPGPGSRADAPAVPPPPPPAPVAMPERTAWPQAGRLGVRTATADAALADQLDLPRGQGLVVLEVAPASPAGRAGLRPHDILLLLDGKAVPAEPWRLAPLVDALPGERPLTAVVLRRGKRETVAGVVLPAGPRPVSVRPRGLSPAGLAAGLPPADLRVVASAAATSLVRTAERFTLREEDGPLLLEAAGTVGPGGWLVEEVVVRVGGGLTRYGRLDEVPPPYRARVVRLLAAYGAADGRVGAGPGR